jgi:ElaB/YqjD/DUF883 family membrane-anchored ribosome-binding protein
MARKTSRNTGNGHARYANGNGASHYLYDDILALAGGLMRNRKDSGAGKIGSLAEATRKFASDLPQMPNLKTYVSSAADQLDYLSGYVMESDLEQMIDDAGTFAKRHPFATLGVAAVAGFGITKLVTSRSHHGSAPPATRKKAASTPPRRAAKSRGKMSRRNAAQAQANA